MSRSLIVFPDDTAQPIIHAIAKATTSIMIKMFVFSELLLLDAVIAAHKRGVKVRIMLNPARRDGKQENVESRLRLTEAGVEVKDSSPVVDLTHEKSMVIDHRLAFIQSLNWESENISSTRDYAITTSHAHEVEEVASCFEADWIRQPFQADHTSHLIWCVGNGRQRIGRLIDDAKHTLWLQHERYQDPCIIEHLVRATQRGVRVHIMARPSHKLKREKLIEGISGLRVLQDVGAKVHKFKHVKLHAKLIFADEAKAIVGSINLAPGSFDSRRELAIEVDDRSIVNRLSKVFQEDWGHSHSLDLSDEALLKELESIDPNVREDFAMKET